MHGALLASRRERQRKNCDTETVEEETWWKPTAAARNTGCRSEVITEKEKSNQGDIERCVSICLCKGETDSVCRCVFV